MDGSNLIFIVMAIVIQICLCTGAAPGAHRRQSFPRACPGTDQPDRTRQRPNPDQASSDPRGSEIPAASAA